MAKFKAFAVPIDPSHTPLVTPAGADYRCSGCGGVVPSGARLRETIRDGMVVGLIVHANGETVHQCGENDG